MIKHWKCYGILFFNLQFYVLEMQQESLKKKY